MALRLPGCAPTWACPTKKLSIEEQQPPNPIKEVFIDESVEEEENEQKNPKEKKKGRKRKSRAQRKKKKECGRRKNGPGKLQLSVCYNTQQGSLFVTIRRCVGLLGMEWNR
uniref:Candidate secreted effector n=1 Tax=Meloidogyne incognita TaxID=6306 RepID=A0A914LVM4_MELIC